jgi:hypothetical protein
VLNKTLHCYRNSTFELFQEQSSQLLCLFQAFLQAVGIENVDFLFPSTHNLPDLTLPFYYQLYQPSNFGAMKFLHHTVSLLTVLTPNLFTFAVGSGDHGDEAECTHGKLYITSRNNTNVYVYDLNKSLQSLFNENTVTLPSTSTNEIFLEGLADSMFVMAVYRGTSNVGYTNGVVNWISTGFYQLDHGDHYHIVYNAPTVDAKSKIACARPIHTADNDGKFALFCDGSFEYEPQVNTTIWVLDEAKLGTGVNAVIHNKTLLGSHHGIAIPVDDDHIMYSLATTDRVNRNPNVSFANPWASTPWTFQVTNYNGNVLHSIGDTMNKDMYCTEYHGSAHKGNMFAFACDGSIHGGMLIVTYLPATETYTSRALFYPPGFGNYRSDTLISHELSPYIIGNFANYVSTNYLFAFEMTDTGSLTNSSLLQLPMRHCAFEFEKSDGDHVLLFMPDGSLSAYTFDKVSSWKSVAKVTVVPGMTTCSQAAFVPGHVQAFVLHYSTSTVYAIDLEDVATGMMTIVTTSLPYTPLSGVVAGAPELYSCGLKAKTVEATLHPSASPSMMPETKTENEPCGLFGLSIFCFRRGKCGLLRRMFNMGGC